MFCTKCGKEIDGTMKFCLNCGAENNMVENKKINEKPKKKASKKNIFIILAVIIAIIGVIFLKTRYTIYEIGETAKLKDFNFTLLDVKYGKNIEIRNNLSDFHLPIEDLSNGYMYAIDGHTFVTITYELEFTGKEPREVDFKKSFFDEGHFWLVYNDDYTITDVDQTMRPSYKGENVLKFDDGDIYAGSWKSLTNYTFQPFGENKMILREYIMVPEIISEDDGKSLILVKDIYRPTTPKTIAAGYSEKVHYRLK